MYIRIYSTANTYITTPYSGSDTPDNTLPSIYLSSSVSKLVLILIQTSRAAPRSGPHLYAPASPPPTCRTFSSSPSSVDKPWTPSCCWNGLVADSSSRQSDRPALYGVRQCRAAGRATVQSRSIVGHIHVYTRIYGKYVYLYAVFGSRSAVYANPE